MSGYSKDSKGKIFGYSLIQRGHVASRCRCPIHSLPFSSIGAAITNLAVNLQVVSHVAHVLHLLSQSLVKCICNPWKSQQVVASVLQLSSRSNPVVLVVVGR